LQSPCAAQLPRGDSVLRRPPRSRGSADTAPRPHKGLPESPASHDRVLALFKFGKRAHIEQLIREGHLYMNPLSYFASYEAGSPRSDGHEGIRTSLQPQKAKLSVEIDGAFHEIPGICGPITFGSDALRLVNVYCMYALRASNAPDLIDPRNFAFGDTFAVFTGSPSPSRPSSPTLPPPAPPRRPAPPHRRPPQSRSPPLSSALDAAPDSRRRTPLPAP
jgi:hypothetical protein